MLIEENCSKKNLIFFLFIIPLEIYIFLNVFTAKMLIHINKIHNNLIKTQNCYEELIFFGFKLERH